MLKVTCAIIIRNKQILIAQHGDKPDHAFQWEFPGGKILPGESPEKCIIREIKEELEIGIEILERIIPVSFDYGQQRIELIPFICRWKSGKIILNEHIAIKWITIGELANTNFCGADKKLISNQENLFRLKKYLGEDQYNA
jgi:8-oxo-dGTP diphosphatase